LKAGSVPEEADLALAFEAHEESRQAAKRKLQKLDVR
jgi:hypothetical protein